MMMNLTCIMSQTYIRGNALSASQDVKEVKGLPARVDPTLFPFYTSSLNRLFRHDCECTLLVSNIV